MLPLLLAFSYMAAFKARLKSAHNQSVCVFACDFTMFAASLLALNPTFSSLPSPNFRAVFQQAASWWLGFVIRSCGLSCTGQCRGSEHLSKNGALQAPDRLTGFQFSESPETHMQDARERFSQSLSK